MEGPAFTFTHEVHGQRQAPASSVGWIANCPERSIQLRCMFVPYVMLFSTF